MNNKKVKCFRCNKPVEMDAPDNSEDRAWEVRWDFYKSELNRLGNMRILCTGCCVEFQEGFLCGYQIPEKELYNPEA